MLVATAPAQAAAPTAGIATTSAMVTPSAKDPVKAKAKPRIMPGKLRIDRRCMTGRVLCVNKSTRKVVLMINGKYYKKADARFGCRRMATREGSFKLYRKSKNHVSRQYGSKMPYAMFFKGGQAVHYSSDFAARGYNGCSHGCVNVRKRSTIKSMFSKVRVGDRVVVYRS